MRCYYELLGVEKTADADEIKKAFRKASLIWHPDKNQSPDATSKFQELQEAYRVLSDIQERAWYDRHRDQILRGGQGGIAGEYTEERLDVYKYFTRSCFTDFDDGPNGFYTVFRNVFEQIADEERRASDKFHQLDSDEEDTFFPTFGRSDSGYETIVRPFYTFWEGFSTGKSYAWAEKYATRGLSSRMERRAAEAENRRLRDAAKKERNDEIRALVAHVRRRDKRVEAERDRVRAAAMEVHEKTREQATKIRQKNIAELEVEWADAMATGGLSSQWESDFQKELDRLEARFSDASETNSISSEATGCGENGDVNGDASSLVDENHDVGEAHRLYCVWCDKVFTTIGAKLNHEASKKHKKQVEVLSAMIDEEIHENAAADVNSEADGEDCTELNDLPKQEVKLTKRAKKTLRRQQRDAKRDEAVECNLYWPNIDALSSSSSDDSVESVYHSDSETEKPPVLKGKLAKPKRPRRRRQRVADSQVPEQIVNSEIRVDVEEQEVTIVVSSSNTKTQKMSCSQTGKCKVLF
ncbi:unnamed protein product [Rodentolepis nana]|uniref:J domain-containing protein n=1 Tax=Rodentolepis nana TaxID=102285 RepID=A0A0R3T3N2_RODNA|nr:unnamed protein product [Rodentolepis nana]